MGLAVHPSTGALIGLSSTISVSRHLEKIRTGNQGHESKWFAVFSAIGLSYRNYKTYLFAAKHPDCPHRVLNRVVTHGQEDFGGYSLCETTSAAPQLLGEVKLLIACAWNSVRGNSVRYEFGYRWYHQTLYNEKFRETYMEVLGITPVLHIGSSFLDECLRADPEGKPNNFSYSADNLEDRSLPIETGDEASDNETLVSEDNEVTPHEAELLLILSDAPREEACGDSVPDPMDKALEGILSPLTEKVDSVSGLTDEEISIDGDKLSTLFDTIVLQLGKMDDTDPRVRTQVKGLWCYTEGTMSQLAYKFGYEFPDLTFAEDWDRIAAGWR